MHLELTRGSVQMVAGDPLGEKPHREVEAVKDFIG